MENDGFQDDENDVSPRAMEGDSCLASDCYSRPRTRSSTSTRCDSLESNVTTRRRRRNLSTETIVEDYMMSNNLNESSKTMKFAKEDTILFKPISSEEEVEMIEKRTIPMIPSQEIITQVNVSCQVSESDFVVNDYEEAIKPKPQHEVYPSLFPYEEVKEKERSHDSKASNHSQNSQFSFSICGCEESASSSSSKKSLSINSRKLSRSQSHKSSSSFGCIVC
jgi:hypothetical protein